MSRGKYSPRCPNTRKGWEFFDRNAKGEIARDHTEDGVPYNEEIHMANYDDEGFDSYGYSAYAADGVYVGIGNGVDRLGYTEDEYLTQFTDDEFNDTRYL